MNILSANQVRDRFDRMSASDVSTLDLEVGRRLLERLELVKIKPDRILDIDCGNGSHSHRLSARYNQALVLSVDGSLNMARAVVKQQSRWLSYWRRQKVLAGVADARALPLATASMDMIFANLFLPWSEQPQLQMTEFMRVLKADALCVFSCYGPDSLQELRAFGVNIPTFIDMHDLGDAALEAGFSGPVMEMERIFLKYKDVTTLCADLTRTGLLSAADIEHIRCHPQARVLDDFILTNEVVYGHAWTPQLNSGDNSFKGVKIQQL